MHGVPEALPFVAKPRQYGSATSGQIKPYLVFTPADRGHFLGRENPDNFFFQEFVTGRSIYLLAHIARDGAVTTCAQENLIQQARGGSMILARRHSFHLDPEAGRYLSLLKSVGFHGLIMIEVRRCDRTGRAVMIEANPRMWGPMQFALDQGVDLFAPLLADHGADVPAGIQADAARPHYFWSGGLTRQSQPYTFHNYSSRQFLDEYPQIAGSDLFLRDDSRRLHAHELTLA
jgi:predicted ATP-grasp superfamily ATP-dependent carboligase